MFIGKPKTTQTIPMALIFLSLVLVTLFFFPVPGNCENQKADNTESVPQILDEEDDFFDEDLSAPDIDIIDNKQSESDSFCFIKGSVEFKAAYNFAHYRPESRQTDHRGLSSLTGKMEVELLKNLYQSFDMTISGTCFYNHAYRMNSRDEYTPHFLDKYEKAAEINKAFIRGEISENIDIKIGRQIVVWGKSDSIRITDIINPINALEPGMTDIKDLRIPEFISRVDYYIKDWSISSCLIHEHRGNRLPVFGSDFYYSSLLEHETETPSMNIRNTGLAMSVSRTMQGMDFALYLARKYDNNPYLNLKTENGFVEPYFDYAKINMAGMALNKAKGNFLFKAETAYINDLHLSAYQNNGTWVKNNNSYSRLDSLLGFEYSGFSDTSISFEASDRWYHNLDRAGKNAGIKANNYQYALRISRTFMNETLELSSLASYFGGSAKDGGFFRFNAEYDVTDSIKIAGGIIFYKSGNAAIFRESDGNDRVFCSIKYSF